MTYEIEYFNVIEEVGTLLNSNITDLKSGRTKWIFPTFPNAETNLPQITIKLDSIDYESQGAGDVLYEEQVSPVLFKSYYAKHGVAQLTIYVITSKTEEFTVTSGGTELFLKNQPLNMFLINEVKKVFLTKRADFLSKFENVTLTNVTPTYENNKNSWASEVRATIKYKDVWVDEFAEGQLIDSYTLNVQIIGE